MHDCAISEPSLNKVNNNDLSQRAMGEIKKFSSTAVKGGLIRASGYLIYDKSRLLSIQYSNIKFKAMPG